MTHLRITLFAGLVATLLAVCPGPENQAFGNFLDGNKLYSKCISQEADDTIMCMSYVAGAIDIIESYEIFDKNSFNKNSIDDLLYLNICLPPKKNINQMMDIITNSLKENPQLRHYTASSLVTSALAKAFPCKN